MQQKEELISRDRIAVRVKELGRMITSDYAGKSLLALGILNGAFIFLADLVREIELPIEIAFLRASSYGDATCSSGAVKLEEGGGAAVAGRDVLLVEDIVDTGRTIVCLREYLLAAGAASVRIAALIDKRERREVEVTVDYYGFTVAEGFLAGYGLDCAGRHRNLPAIVRLTDGAA